jgi:hypothetical protein
MLAQVHQVAERGIEEHRDGVEEEDRRHRVGDVHVRRPDDPRDRGDRRGAADAGAYADHRAQVGGDAEDASEAPRGDQAQAHRPQHHRERAGAGAHDLIQRKSGAQRHDGDLQHLLAGKGDTGPQRRCGPPGRGDEHPEDYAEDGSADEGQEPAESIGDGGQRRHGAEAGERLLQSRGGRRARRCGWSCRRVGAGRAGDVRARGAARSGGGLDRCGGHRDRITGARGVVGACLGRQGPPPICRAFRPAPCRAFSIATGPVPVKYRTAGNP